MITKRVTLKNGQRIRLYCDCDEKLPNFSGALDKGCTCVSNSLLKDIRYDICPKCNSYMWTFSKIKE